MSENNHEEVKRLRNIIIGAFTIVLLTLTIGLSMSGALLLSSQANHQAAATAAALRHREALSQVVLSIKPCKILEAMDGANTVAQPSTPYEKVVANGIKELYISNKCGIILQHKSPEVILKELHSNGS